MQVYKLTRLGRKAVRHGHSSGEDAADYRILQFIDDGKDKTLAEIEVVGDRWRVEKLKGQGLIEELTA